MDYGFAPGNTALLAPKSFATLRGFAHHLLTSETVTRPIDNALIATHANSEAWIFIPMMFPKQMWGTNFAMLEKTLAALAKSTAITDVVIGFTPGDPITHTAKKKGLPT